MTSESVEAALDQLIVATSRLNAILAERGWPTVTLPERHKPIEPFFADLTLIITRLVEVVPDAARE